MPDDDQLLRQCQQGNRAALEELVRRYQDRIGRLALRVLGEANLAEEATAAVLVKVWSKCGLWRGEAGAGTWIYRLAFRTILDTRRGQARWWQRWFGAVSTTLPDGKPGPPEEVARRDVHKHLHAALRELSEEDRALVHLYYYEDRTLGEIEAIVGVPRANLKMRLARARQRLRNQLGDLRDQL